MLAIMLAPGLNIIPVPRVGTPNYGYLPVSGFAALVVLAIYKLRKQARKIALALAAVWLLIAGVATFNSGFQFKNDLTLFTDEVKADPNFIEAYYFLGNYYLQKGDLENAAINFEQALIDRPKILAFDNRPVYEMYLAGVRLEQDRLDEAEKLYEDALYHNTQEDLVHYINFNRAIIAQRKGNYNKVIELLELDVTYWSRPEPYLLLAESYSMLGRKKEESEILEKARKSGFLK
ncbi:hypothetical protein HY008_03130 [Candidatus Woesebacteria bacterium]|nr:hypothetical protein [Candidatus Woesebacteria bacterium]